MTHSATVALAISITVIYSEYMAYRPFTCNDCGDAMSAREVADEQKSYVASTAQTRVRSVRRYCSECHAANEWKRDRWSCREMRPLLDDLKKGAY